MAQVKRINPMSLRNLTAYMRDLPKITRDVGSKIIKELAEDYKRRLEYNILNQTYASTYDAISEAWAKRKGNDWRWINSGELFDSLEIVRKDMGDNRRSYLVGFNNEPHTNSESANYIGTNAEIAYFLEYGYYGGSPLPLIEPTWEEFYPEASRKARAVFKERIRKGRPV